MLRDAVNVSFNMLSVDSDTSTSDTCAILANGLCRAGRRRGVHRDARRRMHPDDRDARARRRGRRASHSRDASHGAASDDEARRIAKSLINSPLVKTMVHGADPNVGRLLMAVGKCFDCAIAPESHRRIDQRLSRSCAAASARGIRRRYGPRNAQARGRGPRGLARRRRRLGHGVRL